MHKLATTFVLGYHGCDQSVADKILSGEDFQPSGNAYDWLGPGVYFWEANPKRGLEFAQELKKREWKQKVKNPAVVGAVIDLGLCLDLTTSAAIQHVRAAHSRLLAIAKKADYKLPINSKSLLLRYLDCAVIRLLHEIRFLKDDPAIDTVRGVFTEGGRLYKGAGFHKKTHIQICVCNPECIKGAFRVSPKLLE